MTTGATRLTDDPGADMDPMWSADGSRLAFWSDRDGNREIYVMGADGSGQTNLTDHPALDDEPAWSPDGSRIAFTSTRDGGDRELYVMNADGSDQTRLTVSPGDDEQAAWSPDGTRIAFASVRSGNLDVWVIDADGDNPINVSADPANDWMPAWSPDGSQLAFVAGHDGNFEIYSMLADGSGRTRLTNSPGFDFQPAWSPDGTSIAFFELQRLQLRDRHDGRRRHGCREPDERRRARRQPGLAAGDRLAAAGHRPRGRRVVWSRRSRRDHRLPRRRSRHHARPGSCSTSPATTTASCGFSDLVVTGSGAQQTLTMTARNPGTATVTFTVSDGQHVSQRRDDRATRDRPLRLGDRDRRQRLLLGAQGDDVLVGRGGDDILCGDRAPTS